MMPIHDISIIEENGKCYLVYITFDGVKYTAFRSKEVEPIPVTNILKRREDVQNL